MGSKNRHAKDILGIILKDRKDWQWYVEPFAGGFNIIDKVQGKRIANDSHFYLIELFRAIQNGWQPPDYVSELQYNQIRQHKEHYKPEMVGFVGFGCSYSGKWFGGYARGNSNHGVPRNYCLESKSNILKQVKGIQGVVIKNDDYRRLEIPDRSIVYCDPPYENTTKYKDGFNHKEFWEWCRRKSAEGHQVFVSEYNAPPDFKMLWCKTVNNTLVKHTGSKQGTEKLFLAP